ncbi:MAG TPA: hypothetical protein VL737_04140 [Candidatus Pristimantibacillus sp.]|jgi:hypothetical protein|nr:hypothetical protein [Candidatus Pristimantibacillus sp.]
MPTKKSLKKAIKQKRFSLIHLCTIVVALGVLGGVALYLQSQSPSSGIATNYNACVKNGGHATSYDGAIQFDACLNGSNQLSLQYSAQNMPRISEHKIASAQNHVVYGAVDPADLVSFLQKDETGCSNSGTVGYYKILKVVPNRFAEMSYGCDNYTAQQKDSAYIIGMRLGNDWALISPTNNMNEQGVPSCLLVDMFRISKSLSGQCYQNTGYGDGSLRPVTYE